MEGAFEVLAKARDLEAHGKSIIHLEIGEPDFETPKNIKDAAIASILHGDTHYTPASGIMDLRKAVAEHISKTRGVPVNAEEVLIAPGTKQIIFMTIMGFVEKGDEVILPNPAYPTYESVVRFVGAVPVSMELLESHDFRFDLNQLEKKITSKTKMIVISSPQNPTGGVLTVEDMERIAFLSEKHDILVLTDEIYNRIVYDTEFVSYYRDKRVKPRTFLTDGFSKSFAMTGWRLGFGVMPKPFVEVMTKLMNNSIACTCTFVQKAGIEALTGPQDDMNHMVEEFKHRRDVIVKLLNEIPGFRCRLPKGAFYAFPNIEGTKMKSSELANFLLEKAGVACVSGTAFGSLGEGYIRFSYANSVGNIEKALRQVKEALENGDCP
jgi:aspartate/methionine/tyrosine aminotransferase